MSDSEENSSAELTHYELLSAQGREADALLYLKQHPDLETAYPNRVQSWLENLTDKRNLP